MGKKPDRRLVNKFASILVLLLLIFSAYSNTYQSPPVLDDIHSFVEEPKVQIESLTLTNLKGLTQTKFGYNRLLPMVSFAWDFFWGKGHISAFHVTNLIIHCICTILVFLFLHTLFTCVQLRYPDEIAADFPVFWLILLLTGLWALNPVQTNAVTYLVQRMTSMAAMFYLLSFICYLQARLAQRYHGKVLRTVVFYLASVIAALGAFLSKQNTAMLPVMMVIAEIIFFTPDLIQRILKKKLLPLGIMLAIVLVGLLVFSTIPEHIFNLYSRRSFTLEERLLTQLRVVSSYVGLLALPLPRLLNLEHDVLLSTSLFSPLSTLFSLIFLASLLVLAWMMRHKQRLITFGLCWFFFNLVIESTIIPLELKFEHRLYLPSIGFYLAMLLVITALARPLLNVKKIKISTTVFVSCSFLLFSIFSSMTYARNCSWADNITLYSDCLLKAPGKARNHSNLGRAYAQVGRYEEAIAESELALTYGEKGNDEYWVAASNIVSAYNAKEELEKAVSRGEELLQNAPEWAKKNSYPVFLHNLGSIYVKLADYRPAYHLFLQAFDFISRCDRLTFQSVIEPAIERDITFLLQEVNGKQNEFAEELGLKPDEHAAIDVHLASLYFNLGKYDRALHYCKQGLARQPGSEKCKVMQEKITLMSAANRMQRQKGTIKNKYFFHPIQSRFHFLMATAYVMEKMNAPFKGILQYCLYEAERMNFTSPDVYLLKSWYFYKQKKYDLALAIVDEGIQLDAEFAQLWVNRGIYALAAGQGQEALSALQKALSLYPGYPHREKVQVLISTAAELSRQSSNLSVNQQHNEVINEQIPQVS